MIILLCSVRVFKRNINIKCISFVLTCITNLDKKGYMGACACVIVVLLLLVVVGVVLFAFGLYQ